MDLKKDILSGLVVVVPVLIVAYIIYWIIIKIKALPLNLATTGQPLLDLLIKSLIITLGFILILLLIGRFTSTLFGKTLEKWIDRQINKLPAIRIVYNASKVALEMALSEAQGLRLPVRLQVTPSIHMTGFKTGAEIVEGKETVFVPTSPNVTTGLILYVDPTKVEEIQESTENILTHILSAGFVEPGEVETKEVETLIDYLRKDKEKRGEYGSNLDLWRLR